MGELEWHPIGPMVWWVMRTVQESPYGMFWIASTALLGTLPIMVVPDDFDLTDCDLRPGHIVWMR